MLQNHQINTTTDFIFLIILGCIGVYSYQLKFRRKETLLILRSVYDGNVSEQLFREDSRLTERSLYTLLITSLILAGSFVVWWLQDSGRINEVDYQDRLIGIVCSGLAYAFRYTILQILGAIGRAGELADHVVFNLKIILSAQGIVLLPLITLAVFAKEVTADYSGFAALTIMCLALGMFLFKGGVISLRSQKVKFLHLFYYFCALEIMPLVWAYRSLLS